MAHMDSEVKYISKPNRVEFSHISGPDGKQLFLIDGKPIMEHKDTSVIDMENHKNMVVDEELNIKIDYIKDDSNYINYKYTFSDLYKKFEIDINNGELGSKYLSNQLLEYYPEHKLADMWCITYHFNEVRKRKVYISTTLLPVNMLKELTRYPEYNNNMLLKHMYENFIRCRLNYYFRPRFTIFLSHSSKDKIIVSDIHALLKNLEYELLYDIEFIQGVTTLVQNIKIALKKSTVILLLITPDSVSSKWVKAEHDEMKISTKCIFRISVTTAKQRSLA